MLELPCAINWSPQSKTQPRPAIFEPEFQAASEKHVPLCGVCLEKLRDCGIHSILQDRSHGENFGTFGIQAFQMRTRPRRLFGCFRILELSFKRRAMLKALNSRRPKPLSFLLMVNFNQETQQDFLSPFTVSHQNLKKPCHPRTTNG